MKTLEQFKEYRDWRAIQIKTQEQDDLTELNEVASPEERIEKAYSELNAQLKADILESFYIVSPSTFELIIIDLLIAMGYGGGRSEMGQALGKTNDGGVDGVIKEDELGLDVVYIQAKKYRLDSSIGRPDIQSFVGSLEGNNATKGVFVTTGCFAKTVEDYVSRIHKRIVLIDGNKLAELMIRNNVGVRNKEIFELKTLDEDYFID